MPERSQVTLKTHISGLIHLILHPYLFRRLVVRELFHRKRHCDKRYWTEWQIYDALISMPYHGSAQSLSKPLNKGRINAISKMVYGIGGHLKVLDVGCGDGSISKTLRMRGHDVISIELPRVASLAKNEYFVKDIIASDAETMPFQNDAFDVVVAAELFEHLWNPISFFRETHRVLKKGGYLIFSSLEGPEAMRYDTHKQYVTMETLNKSLKEMFTLYKAEHLEPQDAAPTYTLVALFRKNEA